MIDMDQKAQIHSVISRYEESCYSDVVIAITRFFTAFRMTNQLFGHFESIRVFDIIIFRAR